MVIHPLFADTLAIRCLFYSKVHVKPVPPDKLKWITQPFPVLAMMTEGSGKTLVPEGKKTRVIQDLWSPYFLAAGQMRQPSGIGPDGFRVLALGFTVEVLGGIGLLNYFKVPLFYSGKLKDQLKQLMLDLYELESVPRAKDLSQLAEQKKMLYDIFGILIQNAEPEKHYPLLSTEGSGCLPAVQYLKEHYASPIDKDKLKRLCHMSQTHFFRRFKRLTGVSPFTYLKDRRIEEAQKLLLTTSLSVAQVGEQVGWPDQFHFSRTFKSSTGYSPQQYRKLYQQGLKF